MYKYPEFLKKEEAKTAEKVSTAVLSTTVKVKARAGRKHKDGGQVETGMIVDTPVTDENKEMTDEEKKKKEEEEKKAAEPEPDS